MKIENLRQNSLQAFGTILSQPKNCKIFEKYIFALTGDDENTYKWCVYQVVGLLLQNSDDNKNTQRIAKQIKSGKIGWKSSTYKDISGRLEEFDNYLVTPFEVVEGVSQCGKCQSKKTWSVQKQTRSSDEPMTTFSRCVECGNQWSYSG